MLPGIIQNGRNVEFCTRFIKTALLGMIGIKALPSAIVVTGIYNLEVI